MTSASHCFTGHLADAAADWVSAPIAVDTEIVEGMLAPDTTYADFELLIRRQMVRLFDASGFNPKRDIAASVLNRRGHARLIEPPDFHYGVDGKPNPLERVRQGYERIRIGHSELNGAQHRGSAQEYGRKAGERAAAAG